MHRGGEDMKAEEEEMEGVEEEGVEEERKEEIGEKNGYLIKMKAKTGRQKMQEKEEEEKEH